ncbi:ATP-binding protein [Thermomonas sp.]|uniref:two-component system sensor histidine kinase NtrB n=1 Tax=Thermomonas sp. TaxID=1971895 RepID=UPI00248968CC|nr:ATP-binding protein [Thermomonas sp.]MDI1252203.1 ATP-binding protein [Thermomonas sp.]
MQPDAIPDPLLDALATPVLRLNAAGLISSANSAAAHWLGVGRRRLVGLPASALERESQRLASALEQAGGDALRLRRMQMAFPGHDELHFADLLLSPMVDKAGDAGYWLEAHPVDEFPGDDPARLLPSALSASLKGLAHELRNPLAGIKGAAQLLARRSEGDALELTELIEGEVERLATLVDRLLSPAPPRAFEPLNIHAVLERVLRLAESDAGWATRLQRDYDPSLPEFPGDADRLSQALWNLVRNAIESGATNVQLRTRAEHHILIGDAPHRLAVRIEIADDGRGVPEDLAERIFLPLVSGRVEGSGLGLALAQQIAREHGGSLSYRSRPGHTVFTLLLPLPLDDDADITDAGAHDDG